MFKVDSDKEFDLEDEDFFQDIFKVSSVETSPELLKKLHNSTERKESNDGQLTSDSSVSLSTLKGTETNEVSFQQSLGSKWDGQKIPFTIQNGKDNKTCDKILSKQINSKLPIESRNAPVPLPVCDQKHKSGLNHPISVFENVDTTFANIPQQSLCSLAVKPSIESSTSNQLSPEELEFLSHDLDFNDSFALESLTCSSKPPVKTISKIHHNTITETTVISTNNSVDKKPASGSKVLPKYFKENCNTSPVLIGHESNHHLTPIINQHDESLEAISITLPYHSSSLLNSENNKLSSEKENQVLSSNVAEHQQKLYNSCPRKEGKDTPLSKKPRKRKFPGPAGLLPNLQLGPSALEFSTLDSPVPEKPPVIPTAIELPSSQTVEDEFTKVPWTNMLNDLEIRDGDPNSILNFNISWIVRKARTKQLPNGKVPVLVVLIKEIDIKGAEASAMFQDRTGEIQGTIHRKLVEEYQMYLKPGCVLVLKQVSVFSPTSRNHYLNLTPNNLVYFYCPLDKVTKVCVQELSGATLARMAQESLLEAKQLCDKSYLSTSICRSPTLFNTDAGSLSVGFIPGVSISRRFTTPQKFHSASQSTSVRIPKHQPPRLLTATRYPAVFGTPRSQIQSNCVTESNLTKCKLADENISSNDPAKHWSPSQCTDDMTKKSITENRNITYPSLNPRVRKFTFKTFNKAPKSLISTESYPYTVENEEDKHAEEHFLVEDELDHVLKNLDEETLLSSC